MAVCCKQCCEQYLVNYLYYEISLYNYSNNKFFLINNKGPIHCIAMANETLWYSYCSSTCWRSCRSYAFAFK